MSNNKTTKFLWYYKRLAKMSFKEILWRIKQKAKTHSYTKKFSKKKILVTSEKLFNNKFEKEIKNFNASFLKLGLKDKYVQVLPEKLFDNLNIELSNNLNIPNWHFSYHNGNVWPLEFSSKLDIKQRDDIGDPRVIWEINRLHYLPGIALKFAATQNTKYLEILEKHFNDWVKNNPFFWGVNWTSPMEAAIRNISFLLTLYYLNKIDTNGKTDKISKDIKLAILNQNEYVKDFYSQHSSANNHLIVEMVSMNIVAMCFDIQDQQSFTKEILEREIVKQTHIDGVNKEQAIHYHAFVLEALLIWLKFYYDKNNEFPNKTFKLIEKMTEYIADMMDEKGNVPSLGDSDEGKIISLATDNHYLLVLDLASIIFNKKFSCMNEISSKTINAINWRLSDILDDYKNKKIKVYEHGGKAIFRKVINDNSILTTFEFGNLGLGPLYAHGHADGLSINLSINGIPIFIDAGTYLYNIKYSYRNSLRLPSAHNTISIERDNFSNSKGAFIWDKSYVTTGTIEGNVVKASLVTVNGNKVERKLEFLDNELFITDSYNSSFITNFIINPDLKVNFKSNKIVEIVYNGKILCTLISVNNINQHKIDVSRTFTKLESTKSLSIRGEKILNIRILF